MEFRAVTLQSAGPLPLGVSCPSDRPSCYCPWASQSEIQRPCRFCFPPCLHSYSHWSLSLVPLPFLHSLTLTCQPVQIHSCLAVTHPLSELLLYCQHLPYGFLAHFVLYFSYLGYVWRPLWLFRFSDGAGSFYLRTFAFAVLSVTALFLQLPVTNP